MRWKRITATTLSGLMAATVVLVRRAMCWGARPDEVAATGTSDGWFTGLPGAGFRMTRAISINADPDAVWPWLAQLGRGAGWYSYDRIDNGGRASAQHIVSWIPEPQKGDAAAIGYVRHLEAGRQIAWWSPDTAFLGAQTWSAFEYDVSAEVTGSRVLLRVQGVATGATRWIVVALFPVVDSIMAIRQLRALKALVERFGARTHDPLNPESGDRAQYQLYHVVYASGDEAGVRGVENARASRRAAESDDVI